jgi:5-methylcytosine-specific restriction endonuclease McrA
MSRKGCPNKVSKKIPRNCLTCNKAITVFLWEIKVGKGKFCSQSCAAISRIDSLRKRSLGNNWGSLRKITPELRKRLSLSQTGKSKPNGSLAKMGVRNPNWRGGVTPINKRIRNSAKFARWRQAVFERDDYTCQFCKQRGGELHPDHIKQFAFYPKLIFKITNGRTLCKSCHQKTDSWGFKKVLPKEVK